MELSDEAIIEYYKQTHGECMNAAYREGFLADYIIGFREGYRIGIERERFRVIGRLRTMFQDEDELRTMYNVLEYTEKDIEAYERYISSHPTQG